MSTILYSASTLGIVAVGVALLMIGGEFDLSAGVSVITASLTASMISYQFSANMWIGALVSLLVMLTIGFINGYLVVRTGIPSFLITLSHLLHAPRPQPGRHPPGHRGGRHARTSATSTASTRRRRSSPHSSPSAG